MDTGIISGICRCCSSEGPSKDLTSKYHWMGEEEIYEKMLLDCFSVSLSTPDDDRTFGGICEVCITQLRNAYNFKKQVILTEEMFKKKLAGGFQLVKLEISKDDGATDSDGDFGANDDDTDYEVPIKMEEEYLEEDSEVEKPKKRSAKAKPSTSKAKKPKVEAESSKKRLQTDDQLICPECNQSFTTLFNIKRHLLRIHGVEAKLTRKMVCDLCGKVVFNSEFLARHLVLGCPVKKKECVKCGVWFHNKSDIMEHMKQKHWSSPIQRMNCPLCDESFKSHAHHDRHLSQDHDIRLDFEELTFFCMEDLISWKEDLEQTVGVCLLKRTSSKGKQYYLCYPKKFLGLIRQPGRSKTCPARIEIREQSECFYVMYQSVHVCESSAKRKTKSQILCPICEMQLHSYEELNSHISSEHDVLIDEHELVFNNFQEFMSWKQDIEKQNFVSFSKRTSYKYGKKNGQIMRKSYFICAMSGPVRGNKKTNKMSKTCPARILLAKRDDSEVCTVSYQATHIDHGQCVKLTKDEKLELGRRIENSESLKDIINTCRLSDAYDPNSKLRNLTRGDLYNIIRDLKIDKSKVNYRTGGKKIKMLKDSEKAKRTREVTDMVDAEDVRPGDVYDINDDSKEDVTELPRTECEVYDIHDGFKEDETELPGPECEVYDINEDFKQNGTELPGTECEVYDINDDFKEDETELPGSECEVYDINEDFKENGTELPGTECEVYDVNEDFKEDGTELPGTECGDYSATPFFQT